MIYFMVKSNLLAQIYLFWDEKWYVATNFILWENYLFCYKIKIHD